MSLVIRPARGEELARAAALVTRSINDLTERHGFGAIAAPRPPDFQAFCLRDDPRGVWLAEDDGEILGFALSWVCDRFWFLAELFVAPGGQGQGIGNELLGRTLGHADQAGASTKSLITFAFNTVSQGLYVRHGLLPRLPIHLCSAERASLAQRLPRPALHARPIQATPADLELLRELDMASLDVSRARHHRYLLEEAPGMRGVFLDDGAEKIGVDVMRWMFLDHKPETNLLFGYHRADETRRRFHIPLWNVYSFFVTYANLAKGWRAGEGERGL